MAQYKCFVCELIEQHRSTPDCCSACGSPVINLTRALAIADANDSFRAHALHGGHPIYRGRVLISHTMHAQGAAFVAQAMQEVAHFSDFNEDNDPFGDHTTGAVTVNGKRVWWKIDLYDAAYENGSEDPLDDDNTRRVLTLFFPLDY